MNKSEFIENLLIYKNLTFLKLEGNIFYYRCNFCNREFNASWDSNNFAKSLGIMGCKSCCKEYSNHYKAKILEGQNIFTRKELASILGSDPANVSGLVKSSGVKEKKLGNFYYILAKDLDKIKHHYFKTRSDKVSDARKNIISSSGKEGFMSYKDVATQLQVKVGRVSEYVKRLGIFHEQVGIEHFIRVKDVQTISNYLGSLKDPNYVKNVKNNQLKKDLVEIHKLNLKTIKEVSKDLKLDASTISLMCRDFNLGRPYKNYRLLSYSDIKTIKEKRDFFSGGKSQKEKDLLDFTQSIYKGEILPNYRKLLDGKELDIYIPEKNLAIEFNGVYWHSDKAQLGVKDIPNSYQRQYAKYRHLEKSEKCKEKGVRLIHIFEHDWNLRKDIVKDIISQALGTNYVKVYARKCELKDIDLNMYKDFLNQNHLQGYSWADFRKGLFLEDKLVEVIGIRTKGNHSKESELVRLCTRKGLKVLGGFSRLLKSFGKPLVSYIDISTFSGGGYDAVGFRIVKKNPPVYFYVNLITSSVEPRYNYMRNCIERKFKKGELKYWNAKETEEVNMYKNGFARIWNCGTYKVFWDPKAKHV